MVLGLAVLLAAAISARAADNFSDNDIRRKLIKESILRYSGQCPCPYTKKPDGSSCGSHSAYKGAGEGYAVLCYETDVTREAVERYRQRYLQKYQASREVVQKPGKRPEKKAFWENF